MRETDLRIVAELGRALWQDLSTSERIVLETVSAASLLDVDFNTKLDRVVTALLERAQREGQAANSSANLLRLDHPFYRLAIEDRVILVALHQGRWSYARLAKMLGISSSAVAERAWRARLELLSLLQMARARDGALPYPVGSQMRTASCPVYQSSSPWTQRFLDEEFESGRERMFLQNHLMACDSCRSALNRCRDVYYLLEKEIPKEPTDSSLVALLEESIDWAYRLRHPSERSVQESLAIFIRRTDVRLVLAALTALVIWKLSH